MQPFGLATPEACKYISPGYAFFAYPGKRFNARNRTPEVCEDSIPRRGAFPILDTAVIDRRYSESHSSLTILIRDVMIAVHLCDVAISLGR